MTRPAKLHDPDLSSPYIGLLSDADIRALSELDGLVSLARAAFDAPIALLTLVDGETVLRKTATGVDCGAIAADSFCNLAAHANQLIVVGDAALDPRFDGKRLGAGGAPIRFCISAPLSRDETGAIGALSILDSRPRRIEPEHIELLADMAKVATGLLRTSRHARSVEQAGRRREQTAVLRYKKMFDRSSALARIGVWECDLADETLTWTDGVYDIFELPRGSRLTRSRIVELYAPDSRVEMERLRGKAIAERSSFCLDVRIRTARGNARWVRLSADVECENDVPVRLFGLKQDITQEKDLLERLQRLAECDPLTGIANRGVFHARLQESIGEDCGLAALLLVDLDGFKQINDTFGHLAGDECLKQVAMRLQSAFANDTLVARIGGDEFALLIHGSRTRAQIECDAEALIRAIRRPVIWNGRASHLGASIGIAIPGRPACNPSELFTQADVALYAAKNAGRNTFRVFDAPTRPQPEPAEAAQPHWF